MIFKKYCILLSEDIKSFQNSVDPDEMQNYAAFHQGLHCLKSTPGVPGIQRVLLLLILC